jgi:hypothetical protein|tara:strand:- start:1603 stop:1980 length:378 start_codon:yes stop_codon:yes gene_type:complete
MLCPKCGWTEGNHLEAQKTDEEFFLEWWIPTIGEEAAKASWQDKLEMKTREAPTVMSDIPGHISMADGTWVDSRSKHRENLKRNGCVELGNDVPMQRQEATISQKSQEARKRQIAELAYAKLNYR